METTHYYYLHTNGELIHKPNLPYIVADFRDSDLVRMYWQVDVTNRLTAWQFLVEAMSMGASTKRVMELAQKWGINDEDAMVYAERVGIILSVDGNSKTATRSDFTNLMESEAGFGDTYLEAMADLCTRLGFNPTKLYWHNDFHQLLKCQIENIAPHGTKH